MRITKIVVSALIVVALAPCVAFGDLAPTEKVGCETALAIADSDAKGPAADGVSGDEVGGFSAGDAVGVDEPDFALGNAAADELDAVEEVESEGSNLASVDEIEAFVRRLYQIVLGREPDEAGLAVQMEGVRTMGAGQVAFNFINSEEFANLPLTNEERVEAVYHAFFDRDSDETGAKMWTSYLDNGMSSGAVAAGFAESPEFVQQCTRWGVEPGDVTSLRAQLGARDLNPYATAFVYRLYDLVLDRPDPEAFELDFQCQALLNGVSAGQLSMNFFNSEEFMGKGLSSEEQVSIVYRAMLDRNPEEGGLEFWAEGLDYGMTAEYVVAGFCDAQEFRDNCADWGVVPGHVDVSLPRNLSIDVTRAVDNAYKVAFNRGADAASLDYWCEVCANRGYIWVCSGFMQADETTERYSTGSEVASLAYRLCLGREVDEASLDRWSKHLDAGHSFNAVLSDFSKSVEFANHCAAMGVKAGSLAYFDVSTNNDLNLKITNIIENITGRDLYKCFLHVGTDYDYAVRATWPSYEGWLEDYAYRFIIDRGGNCYGYASLFVLLARACGYDADVHQGGVPREGGGYWDHGWAEVYIDGTTYVCDPEYYWESGREVFLQTYGNTSIIYLTRDQLGRA